jgi:hypothetical protein
MAAVGIWEEIIFTFESRIKPGMEWNDESEIVEEDICYSPWRETSDILGDISFNILKGNIPWFYP